VFDILNKLKSNDILECSEQSIAKKLNELKSISVLCTTLETGYHVARPSCCSFIISATWEGKAGELEA
jgi:hypothetical protein